MSQTSRGMYLGSELSCGSSEILIYRWALCFHSLIASESGGEAIWGETRPATEARGTQREAGGKTPGGLPTTRGGPSGERSQVSGGRGGSQQRHGGTKVASCPGLSGTSYKPPVSGNLGWLAIPGGGASQTPETAGTTELGLPRRSGLRSPVLTTPRAPSHVAGTRGR